MFQKVCLVILGLLLGVYGSELFLRIYNPGGIKYFVYSDKAWAMAVPSANPLLSYELPPSTEHSLDVTYTINRWGLRGKEIELQHKDKGLRITVLGDSITFGMSVPDNAPFPVVLEETLKSQHNKDDEVLNGGVISYNILQYYESLRRKLIFFHPDVVIVMIISNDGRLNETQLEYLSSGKTIELNDESEIQIPPSTSPHYKRWSPPLLTLDYLQAFTRFLKYTNSPPPSNHDTEGHFRIDFSNPGWQYNLKALDEIIALCKRKNIKLLISSERYSPELEIWLTHRQLPYFPTYFGEEKERMTSLRISNSDPHPSPEGHKWIASKMFSLLKDNGYLQ